MMREQIEGLLGHGDFTCTPVRNGNSDAQVCKVQAGGKTWAAKIFPQKPCLNEWYALLREIGEPHLVSAWVCRETEGTVCTLTPWIEGPSLDARLAHHPEEAAFWGEQAAALVKKLHKQPVDEARFHIRYSEILDHQIDLACKAAERLSLPQITECCAYLSKFRTDLRLSKVCLLHKDMHPENFLIRDGELYLIDFDNGGLGECEQDIVRLLDTFGEQSTFVRSFLQHYLGEESMVHFWERCMAYRMLTLIQQAV